MRPTLTLRGNVNRDQGLRSRNHAARVALEWIKKRYPLAFPSDPKNIHPLAIGIRGQLLESIQGAPNAPEPAIVARALTHCPKSPAYVRAAADGRDRLNLEGESRCLTLYQFLFCTCCVALYAVANTCIKATPKYSIVLMRIVRKVCM